jgi:hypothetical protein
MHQSLRPRKRPSFAIAGGTGTGAGLTLRLLRRRRMHRVESGGSLEVVGTKKHWRAFPRSTGNSRSKPSWFPPIMVLEPTQNSLGGGTVKMARNVGPEDRVVRIVVALGLGVLIYMGVIGGQIATIVTCVIAAYLLITGLFARCLLYKVIDVDTSVQEQPYSTTDDRAGL